MFPFGIIHAECIGGDIDLLLNQRVTIGFFPWRFVDGEASIGRCVAFVEDKQYEELMKKKEGMEKTRFGDAIDPTHVDRLDKLSKANMG
jgi:arylformamidase